MEKHSRHIAIKSQSMLLTTSYYGHMLRILPIMMFQLPESIIRWTSKTKWKLFCIFYRSRKNVVHFQHHSYYETFFAMSLIPIHHDTQLTHTHAHAHTHTRIHAHTYTHTHKHSYTRILFLHLVSLFLFYLFQFSHTIILFVIWKRLIESSRGQFYHHNSHSFVAHQRRT
jgi:hypothetical protein